MSEAITIGITCYNAESTIVRALDSAAAQNYPYKEILVVNDASTDKSESLIRTFIDSHPDLSMRYIAHATNRGFPAALNTLLYNTDTPYIAFFDDDDVSTPDRLDKQMQRLTEYSRSKNTDLVFCYTNRAVFLPGNDKPANTAKAIGRNPSEPYGEDVADFILWRSYKNNFTWGLFGSCTMLTKTQNLTSMGYFDESFRRSAELDMAIRAARKDAHFIAVDESLVLQYKTPTNDKSGKIPLQYSLKLREKYKEFLQEKGVYLASRCLAHYQFYTNKKNKTMMVFWMLLASLAAPEKIVLAKIKQKFR